MRTGIKNTLGGLSALPVALVLSLMLCGQSAQAKAAKTDGWNINFASNYAGTVLCQLTMKGIRMKMDKMGLISVTRSPDWTLYIYNETNHNMIQMPYSEWKNKLSFGKFHPSPKTTAVKPVPIKTGKTMTIQGLKAQEFIVKKPNPRTKLNDQVASVWMTTEIKAPEQFSELVHNFLNVPSINGCPLRVTEQKMGKTVQDLDAFKIEKGSLADSLFEPMKGFKKVKDEMALMLDEGDMDLVGGMH